jgi:hypothetical protein
MDPSSEYKYHLKLSRIQSSEPSHVVADDVADDGDVVKSSKKLLLFSVSVFL